MSNCPKCGLPIEHGVMSTTLPLCKCSWQQFSALGVYDELAACKQQLAAEQEARKKAEAEIENLHTVMMAAAVEITEHWDAHCDTEGYGPENLVRRLENGYPEQYGYDAKAFVQMTQRAEAAEAIIKASREQEAFSYVYRGTDPVALYLQPPIPPDVAELQRNLSNSITAQNELHEQYYQLQRENAELQRQLEEIKISMAGK